MAYDFSTINDEELENLAQDILNAKFGMDLQDFKGGKDQGIDLRYSTPSNNNCIVVQVKHLLRSGYKQLYGILEKDELPKVIRLNPCRYMLVTSVELSALNKDAIVILFHPYIQSANDVFGAEDLNKCLRELPDLEKRWFKLWLSSTNVLQSILHNAVRGRSAFVESKIRRTIQLNVHCKSYDEAFDLLAEHKYILITGQPGVGKTTLAYLLSYSLMSQGHELIYIDSDVKDAEDLFNASPGAKQVFFFDDFLGATYLEINHPKTTESAFVNFLERIKHSENKYLILTTRTSIYSNALDKYEKMKRIRVDIARKEIELGQYSLLNKARILYNHFYHSSLSDEQKAKVIYKKQYWKIIQHRNYNPRLVEFITDPRNIPTAEATDYMKFVIRNFDNPAEVWRYCYLEQLSAEEKILLNCIYSQKIQAPTDDTGMLFDHMLQHEINNYNHRPISNPFSNSLKRLLDGILKRELHLYANREHLNFINPSIQDFLNNYFLVNTEDRWKLFHGSIAIEQFEKYEQAFYGASQRSGVDFTLQLSQFANYLLSIANDLIACKELKITNYRKQYTQLRLASLLSGLRGVDEETQTKINDFVYKTIAGFDIDQINIETRYYYIQCIRYYSEDSILSCFIMDNWNEIILGLFLASVIEEEYEELKDLFSEYHKDYWAFVNEESYADDIYQHLSEYIDDKTTEWIDDELPEIYSEEDVDSLKEMIKQRRRSFFSGLGLSDDAYQESAYFGSEWKATIDNNIARRLESKSELVNNQVFYTKEDENNVMEIEKLFTGTYDPDYVSEKADFLNLPF